MGREVGCGALRAAVLLAMVVAAVAAAPAASAAPALRIEPLTWNVIGLDHNDVSQGPNVFLVGARVCNTGDAAATGVSTAFVWDSDNPLVTLRGTPTLALGDLAPGQCADAYYDVAVARNPAARGTARGYHIEATGNGLGTVSTPRPRELFVQPILSQNRNDATAVTGPTEVVVGQTYQYETVAATSPQGFPQLEVFLDFPNTIFRILDVDVTYGAPSGATNDRIYADACGWESDPTSSDYLSCVGPPNYAGGRVGGTVTTVYTVQIVGTGTATMMQTILDISGGSYHYNADFNTATPGVEQITVTAVAPPDLAVAKTHTGDFTVGVPADYTITVSNAGSGPTLGALTVSDPLPSGLVPVAAAGAGWTCDVAGQDITCTTPGPLAAGASSAITVTVRPEAAAVPGVTNTVTVATPGDLDPDNDRASDPTTVRQLLPGLTVEKRAEPPGGQPVAPGAELTYTIVVTSAGQATAHDVVLTDPFPAGTTALAVTLDGVEVGDGAAALAAGLPLGDLTPGTARTVTARVRLDPAAAGTLRNVATATATGVVPVTGTVSHPIAVVAGGAPQLTLAKTASVAAAAPGDTVTFTITVANLGAATARQVALTDPTPAGLDYVPASTSRDGSAVADVADGRNPLADGLALGDLAPGQVVVVQQSLRVASAAPGAAIINLATITTADVDQPASTAVTIPITASGAPPPGQLPATGARDHPREALVIALCLLAFGVAMIEISSWPALRP
ncbi:MAG: DUF11 domain-containing protein [Actinobacteria bacterium]|nr:DUF11 domain-containing protein [Actinomycetota bacterium]